MIYTLTIVSHPLRKLYGEDLNHPKYAELARAMKAVILKRIEEFGKVKCIYGLRPGLEQLFGIVALHLKEEGYPIKTMAVLASKNEEDMYVNTMYWKSIKDASDQIYLTHNGAHCRHCDKKKVKYMIRKSNEIIAVWNRSKQTTTYTGIKYALKKGKWVVNIIDPMHIYDVTK